jgi:hypothetical protein
MSKLERHADCLYKNIELLCGSGRLIVRNQVQRLMELVREDERERCETRLCGPKRESDGGW